MRVSFKPPDCFSDFRRVCRWERPLGKRMAKNLQRLAYAMARLPGAEAIEAFGSARRIAYKQRRDNIVNKNDRARMEKQIELAGVRDLTVHRFES